MPGGCRALLVRVVPIGLGGVCRPWTRRRVAVVTWRRPWGRGGTLHAGHARRYGRHGMGATVLIELRRGDGGRHGLRAARRRSSTEDIGEGSISSISGVLAIPPLRWPRRVVGHSVGRRRGRREKYVRVPEIGCRSFDGPGEELEGRVLRQRNGGRVQNDNRGERARAGIQAIGSGGEGMGVVTQSAWMSFWSAGLRQNSPRVVVDDAGAAFTLGSGRGCVQLIQAQMPNKNMEKNKKAKKPKKRRKGPRWRPQRAEWPSSAS